MKEFQVKAELGWTGEEVGEEVAEQADLRGRPRCFAS